MSAKFSVKHGTEFPFNRRPPADKAETAALGILADLTDRRGVKSELNACDLKVRDNIVVSLAAIIREVYGEQ